MRPQKSDLTVRRHERFECDLAAEMSVADPCAHQVRLSKQVGRDGCISAAVIDYSAGGLGLRSGVLLPKQCLLRVVLFEGPVGGSQPAMEALVRVQRVRMLDRAPTFYLGCAFEGDSPLAGLQRLHEAAESNTGAPRA